MIVTLKWVVVVIGVIVGGWFSGIFVGGIVAGGLGPPSYIIGIVSYATMLVWGLLIGIGLKKLMGLGRREQASGTDP
jgi:hypothetical protein